MSDPKTVSFKFDSLKSASMIIAVDVADEPEPLSFTLKRPGRGGVSSIAQRMSATFANDVSGLVYQRDVAGAEMDAIMLAYCTEFPERFAHSSSKELIDPYKVPADLWLALGKEAVKFHARFRDVDVQFGAESGEGAKQQD